jgi:hypothetical protein
VSEQAFPTPGVWDGRPGDERQLVAPSGGMSLRDYFAAASLQGLRSGAGWTQSAAVNAEQAYKDADAMLSERNKL